MAIRHCLNRNCSCTYYYTYWVKMKTFNFLYNLMKKLKEEVDNEKSVFLLNHIKLAVVIMEAKCDRYMPLPSALSSKLSLGNTWMQNDNCKKPTFPWLARKLQTIISASPVYAQSWVVRAQQAGQSVTDRNASPNQGLVMFIKILWGPQTTLFIDGFWDVKRISANKIKCVSTFKGIVHRKI